MKHDNLVIDVSMHTGEDTAVYLAKDFDVVAIEANPALVERAKVAFADAIDTGRLRIYEAAIAEQAGSARLAVADDMTIWSSLSPAFIELHKARGTRYRYLEVPAVSFESVLAEVGIPHYLKVDIEGLDMLCVRALQGFARSVSSSSHGTTPSLLHGTPGTLTTRSWAGSATPGSPTCPPSTSARLAFAGEPR